jgi:hypothetical protein
MVTLRKYLYGPWQANAPQEELTPRSWRDLLLRITNSAEQHVLGADTDADLRDNLKSVRTTFDSAPAEVDLKRAAEEFAAVLKNFRERADQTARAQSHDLYRILTTLNEALLLLAAGSTRTVSRLKQLEVSLERVTTLNDIAALRSGLTEILTLVREDARRERVDLQRDLTKIERQIKDVRSGPVWLRSELPGREEAISRMERLSESSDPAGPVPHAAAVFVLGRIREIVRRYGDSAADNLVAELLHRRIQFSEADPMAFRWSPEVLVICLRCPDGVDRLNALIEPQIETPFEHRVFLGARVAVLRVGLHWVVLPVTRPATSLAEQIDRFAGEHT